eukprot:1090429-Rhodomonas_salina.1
MCTDSQASTTHFCFFAGTAMGSKKKDKLLVPLPITSVAFTVKNSKKALFSEVQACFAGNTILHKGHLRGLQESDVLPLPQGPEPRVPGVGGDQPGGALGGGSRHVPLAPPASGAPSHGGGVRGKRMVDELGKGEGVQCVLPPDALIVLLQLRLEVGYGAVEGIGTAGAGSGGLGVGE